MSMQIHQSIPTSIFIRLWQSRKWKRWWMSGVKCDIPISTSVRTVLWPIFMRKLTIVYSRSGCISVLWHLSLWNCEWLWRLAWTTVCTPGGQISGDYNLWVPYFLPLACHSLCSSLQINRSILTSTFTALDALPKQICKRERFLSVCQLLTQR